MNQTVRLRVNNEIPAYRTGLVSALDVGTSKIVCVIGQADAGSLKVLGSALRESAGLKAGTFAIWKGPIVGQDGKEVLKKDEVADDKFLGGVNFFVKGVEGKVPGGTK